MSDSVDPKPWRRLGYTLGALTLMLDVLGCQPTERVADVEAPGVKVQVDRNKNTGDVHVDVKTK